MHAEGKLVPSLMSLSIPSTKNKRGRAHPCTKDGGTLLQWDTRPTAYTHPRNAGHLVTVEDNCFSEAHNSVTPGIIKAPTLKTKVILVMRLLPKCGGKPEIPSGPHRQVLCGGSSWKPRSAATFLAETDSGQKVSNQEEKKSWRVFWTWDLYRRARK